jgi:hypothetical protein
MKIDNIDAFNITAMELFDQSLESFPMPIDIDSLVLATTVLGYFKTPECDSELQDSLKFLTKMVDQTIMWLESEDYLKRSGITLSSTYILLTSKGLNTINSVPSYIEDSKPFKDIFKSGLAKASVSTVTGLMVDFFKVSS